MVSVESEAVTVPSVSAFRMVQKWMLCCGSPIAWPVIVSWLPAALAEWGVCPVIVTAMFTLPVRRIAIRRSGLEAKYSLVTAEPSRI